MTSKRIYNVSYIDGRRPLTVDVLDLPRGWAFRSIGGPTLKVARRGWPSGTEIEDALSGRVLPVAVIATEDGDDAYLDRMHEGPEADPLYVERYEKTGAATGRTFHGFIDSMSRCVVQAG